MRCVSCGAETPEGVQCVYCGTTNISQNKPFNLQSNQSPNTGFYLKQLWLNSLEPSPWMDEYFGCWQARIENDLSRILHGPPKEEIEAQKRREQEHLKEQELQNKQDKEDNRGCILAIIVLVIVIGWCLFRH